MERYLSCVEVAALYGVKKKTVWEWIRKNKLGAIQTGKIYRIRQEDILAFNESRATK